MAIEIDQDKAAAEAQQLVEQTAAQVQGFAITSDAQYRDSAGLLQKVKAAQKRLEEMRTAITGPLNAALRAANDLFRDPAQKLVDAERGVKREMARYADELERKRREEQARADEAARKERERLERRAAEAQEKGKDEKADQLQQRAATVMAPIIQREAPKVAGIVTRDAWKAEVVDLAKLVAAIAAGQAPLSLVQANTAVIGQQARSLKQDFQAPGIRVWNEGAIAARAAK